MKRFLLDMLTLTLGLCLILVIGGFIEGRLAFFTAFGLTLTLIACIRLAHIESTRKQHKAAQRKTVKQRVAVPHVVTASVATHKKSAPTPVHLHVA